MVMNGTWHQFGDRSQKLALEQLEAGNGEGCIISPRYLSWSNARDYAEDYKHLDAKILWDPEFYAADDGTYKRQSYPTRDFRNTREEIAEFSAEEIKELAAALTEINGSIRASAVLAPAVTFKGDIDKSVECNRNLFAAAKKAASNLDVPVVASIPLGKTITGSDSTISSCLSSATEFEADCWYLGFAFPSARIPDDKSYVKRFCQTCLSLAGSGKPVFHQSAGPMSLLSYAVGASGVGIGHWQNLWQFSPERYKSTDGQGGGGGAPARFFSSSLWGTIIVPDEVQRLPQNLKDAVLTTTAFSRSLVEVPRTEMANWKRWDANKHLIYILGNETAPLSDMSPTEAAEVSEAKLADAVGLHRKIREHGIELREESRDTYQSVWLEALREIRDERKFDYKYLEMLPESEDRSP